MIQDEYRRQLWINQDDTKIRGDIKTAREAIKIGVINKRGGGMFQKSVMINHQGMSAYEWTKEVQPLKEYFLLELKTIDLLVENKNAALRQDHMTTAITMNLIRDCL